MVRADALVERALSGLHGRGIGARFVSCPEEARKLLLGAIRVSEVVGVGNSQTVKATSPGLRPEEIEWTKREALLSDVYLSSANAISADGYPSLRAGRCVDCASPERVCRILCIIEGRVDPNRITVILIGADMGF